MGAFTGARPGPHMGTHMHTEVVTHAHWHGVLIIMSGKINFEFRAFHVCPHAQQAPSIFTASLLSVFWQSQHSPATRTRTSS